MMGSGEHRRAALLRLLRERGEPVTGLELANCLGVSRQVIVQDIALLRAAGEQILATPRGYTVLPATVLPCLAVLAVRHSREETADELTVLVDHGLRVVDVVVEHPVYGEIRCPLMLQSRSDVAAFLEQVGAKQASLLSDLTGGVHLHTVEAPSRERLDQARAELRRRGLLLDDGERSG